ncbi:MAG: hypothetical protein ACJ77B_01740 [Chloroflexota bacterium]
MRTKPALVLVAVVAALAACTTPAAAPSQPAATRAAVATLTASAVPEPTVSPSASPEPTATALGAGGSTGPKATPGSVDPCTLLTSDEASRMIGKQLGAGVSTVVDNGRVCTFKSGLTEVKVILTPPAPDVATAQAYWDSERTKIAADVPIKDLPDFDRSAFASGSVGGVSLSALFVIQDKNFFDLYCGFPACSEKASIGGAEHIVGRLH